MRVRPMNTIGSLRSAISEFAPLNSFYAGGHKLTIDQVDINTAKVEPWRIMPELFSCFN